MASYISTLQLDAGILAKLDVLNAFTRVAAENRYSRPTVDDSLEIKLVEARHPVIERQLPRASRISQTPWYSTTRQTR